MRSELRRLWRSAGIDGTSELSSQAFRGGALLAARYGIGIFISLANMLVLTWWIGPHAYGIFVTAIGIVSFLAAVGRVGTDTYLVRSPVVPDETMYSTAIFVILISSAILAGLAAAMTPLLIRWYGSREFVAPYLVLLMTVPVSALAGIPTAKLERGLEFTRVAGIELAGQFTGLIASVTLARLGSGVWAPVAGQSAWQVFVLISTFYASSERWNFRFRIDEARKMLRYGIGLTVSLRAWQARTLVNPMLVGRFAGAEAVAYVALALRIAESLGALRLAAGRIAIAVLARLQQKTDQFRSALEQALHVQVLTLGPLLCAFALSGSLVMKHVIGVRWMPSLAVYPFVAAGVLVNSVYNLQASGLFVRGKQWIVTSAFAVHVALLAGITWLLVPKLRIAGYGWAELGACGGYWIIHSGTEKSFSPSYRRLAPLTAGFIAILFLVPTVYGAFQ